MCFGWAWGSGIAESLSPGGAPGAETPAGLLEGLQLLGVAEPHQALSGLPRGPGEEGCPRHRRDPSLLHEAHGGRLGGGLPHAGDVREDVIRPLGHDRRQPDLPEGVHQQGPLGGIVRPHLLEEVVVEVEACGDAVLQGGRRADVEEVVDELELLGHLGRCDDVAESPPRDAEGLGETEDRHRAACHGRRDGGRGHVLAPIVGDRLVDLVRDHDEVELLGDAGRHLELLPGQHPPRGIGGGAQHQPAGPRRDRRARRGEHP